MARLLIANVRDSSERPINIDFVKEIQGKIGNYFETKGAYVISSGQGPSTMGTVYELPDTGTVSLRGNWIEHGKPASYLSSEALISGARELWELGSPTVKRIKDIFEQFQLNLYRDELTTELGRQYVAGAEFSSHMSECNGVTLLKEFFK